MRIYKVVPRNSAGWRNHTAATLGVSVLSPNWQGERFAAITKFTTKNFTTIRIDVTDALYRHHFIAQGMTAEEAQNKANALGSLWLAQQQDVIHTMAIKPIIIRWQEWYSHPDYQATLDAFHTAYEKNMMLQAAIEEDVQDFYNRQSTQPTERQMWCGRDYLIEELAIFTLQAIELPSAKIYPGDELKCSRLVRAGLIPEAPKGLENEQFMKIKLERREAPDEILCNATNNDPSYFQQAS